MEARHSLIELLMKAGADPKIRNKVGLSPCENAHVLKVQKEMLHKEVSIYSLCMPYSPYPTPNAGLRATQ